ncbi:MAG: TrkH family potassium uptake protein [Alistipes sp.]|nr:TrkH family potassium uptake protein [Alistipes sp.]
MRLGTVLRYVGIILTVLAAFMMLSAVVSYYNDFDGSFTPLLMSSLLTLLLGCFPLIFVPKPTTISQKEGFCIVVGAWLAASFVGMFPYLMWGGEFSLINAWFESVSGFTTTGASILNNVEALPMGLQFWRFCTSWVGGVGVVMFALILLPSIGKSKMMLSNVELSSLAKDNFNYRTLTIVRIILSVYIGMTIVATLLLKFAGMGWFDALCHAMSACGTCGFSTRNLSIGFYDSATIEMILVVVMALAGIHFGLLYATITGKKNNIFRSEVTRFYFIIIGVATVVVSFSLWLAEVYPTLFDSFRSGLFHVVSCITTTGLVTADCNTWTSTAMLMLMFLMFVCACAGSTSGGLKIDRLLLALKMMRNRLRQQQHPGAVFRTKVDGVPQSKEMLDTVMVYTVAFLMMILLGAFINMFLGSDLMTGFSSSLACASNVGPGFGDVGTMNNYSAAPVAMKINLSLLMLLGRLEIFGLIQLFFIRWWK